MVLSSPRIDCPRFKLNSEGGISSDGTPTRGISAYISNISAEVATYQRLFCPKQTK